MTGTPLCCTINCCH